MSQQPETYASSERGMVYLVVNNVVWEVRGSKRTKSTVKPEQLRPRR